MEKDSKELMKQLETTNPEIQLYLEIEMVLNSSLALFETTWQFRDVKDLLSKYKAASLKLYDHNSYNGYVQIEKQIDALVEHGKTSFVQFATSKDALLMMIEEFFGYTSNHNFRDAKMRLDLNIIEGTRVGLKHEREIKEVLNSIKPLNRKDT